MSYVDGFLIPLSFEKLEHYKSMSSSARDVWMEHGALDYKECVLDHDNISETRSFKSAADVKQGETAIFAFIIYNDRAHRDAVNAKAMADPRLSDQCKDNPPFDWRRMAYGGFTTIVEVENNL